GLGVGLGPPFQFPARMEVDPISGVAYVVDAVADSVFAVDPVTRDRTIVSGTNGGPVGTGPAFDRPVAAALDGPNTLIVCDRNLRALFAVDLASGARTIIAGDPNGVNIGTGPEVNSSHLVVIPGGDIVMDNDFEGVLIRVDRSTGNRTVISGQGVGSGPPLLSPRYGVAISDSSSVYLGESSFAGILRVNLATGDREIVTDPTTVGTGGGYGSIQAIYALPGYIPPHLLVFADGFESGDTNAWSSVVP
ncbi:MAG: hypothetical protein K8J08_20745, partial [Thermoanaerobaculia bacterium]|nr:hypothetical protein [Thermoanaerobaculia bacterium]